jgi:hypothetical protein
LSDLIVHLNLKLDEVYWGEKGLGLDTPLSTAIKATHTTARALARLELVLLPSADVLPYHALTGAR